MGVEGLRPQRPRALLGSTAAVLRPFGSASFTPASRRSARPIDGLFSANNGHALTNLLGHTEVQNLRAAHSPIRVFVPTLSDRAAVHKTNNAVKATSHPNLVIPLRSCGRHCGPAPARSKPFLVDDGRQRLIEIHLCRGELDRDAWRLDRCPYPRLLGDWRGAEPAGAGQRQGRTESGPSCHSLVGPKDHSYRPRTRSLSRAAGHF